MSTDFRSLLMECDAAIKQGRPQRVGARMADVNLARVPREFRAPLAKICRRAGLHSTGLKLLTPVVNSHQPNALATPEEMAEYGMLLLRHGALNEAIERLSSANLNNLPEALLYRSLADFARWEHERAIPSLQEYISKAPSEYAYLVGRTNLAFALIEAQKLEAAELFLFENIQLAEKNKHQQMQANNLALCAQVHFRKGQFKAARQFLASSLKLTSESQTADQFYATKSIMILDGLELKDKGTFERLRTMAIEQAAWEVVREADLYALKIDFVRERYLHLYFGTPFKKFREFFFSELGSIPEQKTYVLGSKSAPRFDLRTGQIDGRAGLNPGRKIHQVVDTLLRDFYRPLTIGEIFSALYPDERFNIFSSPQRIHQHIRLTREWIADKRIPVTIRERKGFYSLEIDGNFSFRVPLERTAVKTVCPHLHDLKSAFKERFTAKEVQAKLKLSAPTVSRLIQRGLKEGSLIASGKQDRCAIFEIADRNE